MVLTEDVLALCEPVQPGGALESWDDVIPLHEIADVQDLTAYGLLDGVDVFDHLEKGLLAIHCENGGRNRGRKYCLQVTEPLDLRRKLLPQPVRWTKTGKTSAIDSHVLDLITLLNQLAADCRRRKRPKTAWQKSRMEARNFSESMPFQMFVAFLIVANFFTNAYEAQMNEALTYDLDTRVPKPHATSVRTLGLYAARR